MVRSPLNLLAALSVAVLTYFILFMMIMTWAVRMLSYRHRYCCCGSATWMLPRGFPVEIILVLASIAPSIWLTVFIFGKVRRHNRECLNQCLECGCDLPFRRGRCPDCGTFNECIGRPRPLFPLRLLKRRRVLPFHD